MRQKLLLLSFLATILFFGSCSKDYLGDTALLQESDMESKSTKSTDDGCGGFFGNCETCGLCLNPNCYLCLDYVCCCSPCATARCPKCNACTMSRTVGRPLGDCSCYNYGCSCYYTPQADKLGCFISAMQYVAQIREMDISYITIRRFFVENDNDDFPGVPTWRVPYGMARVFGGDYYEVPRESMNGENMEAILTSGSVIITNFQERGCALAHAVVVTGYIYIGDTIYFSVIDPGYGEICLMSEAQLEWNNSNKFMVVVSKY